MENTTGITIRKRNSSKQTMAKITRPRRTNQKALMEMDMMRKTRMPRKTTTKKKRSTGIEEKNEAEGDGESGTHERDERGGSQTGGDGGRKRGMLALGSSDVDLALPVITLPVGRSGQHCCRGSGIHVKTE